MNRTIKGLDLLVRLNARSATVGIIGLGYVGLPLAAACGGARFKTIGFDIDGSKPAYLNAGKSYIAAVPDAVLSKLVSDELFFATCEFQRLSECDVIVICVPTPLTKCREPDLSYIESTSHEIARHLRQTQLVILESTSFPGTTREVLKPILEMGGLKSGSDFFIGFSPEREDPGNEKYGTATIPKVVAGDGEAASELVAAFYGAVVKTVVRVSSPETAEATKITENVFRAVNIALMNELKVIYDAMGIDVWEVIEAAKTKPFGFMPFYPGPGLGGHCIPIDPFYLTWKSREFELPTRFIELAGEINISMPRFVISRLSSELDRRFGVPLSKARILLVGLSYKKNVPDIRESPSFRLMEILESHGARQVDYHDPHVPEIPSTREHGHFSGRRSVPLTDEVIGGSDVILISTDHDAVDYDLLSRCARLIVDTRNVMARKGLSLQNVVKA